MLNITDDTIEMMSRLIDLAENEIESQISALSKMTDEYNMSLQKEEIEEAERTLDAAREFVREMQDHMEGADAE